MKHLIALVPQWPHSLPHATTSTVFVMIFFIFFIFFKLFKRKPMINSPPSPPRFPIIGNLHQLGSMPHRSLQALSKKYGDIMLLHLGHVPTIVVSSKEMARDVLKTHDLIFASRPFSSMSKRLQYGSTDIAFAPYGEYWRQARRLCVLQLLSLKRVQLFRSVREEEVSLFIEKIRESGDGLVNLATAIVNLTNDIVCRVALGKKHFGGDPDFGEMLEEYICLLGSFPVRDFIPWLGWIDSLSGLDARARRNHMEINGFLDKVFDEHLLRKAAEGSDAGDGDDGDFVDFLLSLEEKDAMVGISISRDNRKAIVLDMFEGGTHTIFSVIQWAMAELIKNPTAMKKAQEEVRKFSGAITEESIGRMEYLKAVIKETLRLHPPVPLLIPHETTQDVELQGYDIRAGTRVLVNAWAIGRDPRYWDLPEEFSPERFVNCDIDFKGQDFEFIPFGAGRRGCPAIEFGVATVELALAHLLHRFDWELPDGMKGEEMDMSESSGLSVHKRSSLLLVAKPRP